MGSVTSEADVSSETFSFTIFNRSDDTQSYTLLSQAPTVDPPIDHIASHAILVAKRVTPGAGFATFVIERDNLHAICGTMYQDEAAQMYALDKQAVRLGASSGGAGKKAGTTCVLKIDSGSPYFDSLEGSGQAEGKPGAFCLKTKSFSYKDAQSNGYIVALGLSTSPNAHVGVHASFTPFPNTIYQIFPSKVYYIVPLALRANQPKPDDVDLVDAIRIDFSKTPPHVQIVHDGENKLSILTEEPPPAPKL